MNEPLDLNELDDAAHRAAKWFNDNDDWEFDIGQNSHSRDRADEDKWWMSFLTVRDVVRLARLLGWTGPVKCENCHEKKADVEWTVNPFALEIHNETTKQWLCKKCYADLLGDI